MESFFEGLEGSWFAWRPVGEITLEIHLPQLVGLPPLEALDGSMFEGFHKDYVTKNLLNDAIETILKGMDNLFG